MNNLNKEKIRKSGMSFIIIIIIRPKAKAHSLKNTKPRPWAVQAIVTASRGLRLPRLGSARLTA